MKLITIIIFVFIGFYSKANIGNYRSLQLDSVVTNINKNILKNLDSLHSYIERNAKSDEERVFMYYGVIAIHYKYDHKRAKLSSKKSVEYTPHYTAYKRSGVCRDFAALIKELCDRSNIPCVVAVGRAKVGLLGGIKDFFLRRLNKSNHAWNVIKYDSNWHTVDATWSRVIEVKKKIFIDSTGKKIRSKIKVASREYFNPMYDDVYNKRKAEHPAFYAEPTIYTYKSIYDKKEDRIIFKKNYNYFAVLDSLSSNKYYKFSSEFEDSSAVYSDNTASHYYINVYRDFLKLKRSKYNKLTLEECESHLLELNELDKYLLLKDKKVYFARFDEHRLEVENLIAKFKKKKK